MKTPAVFWDGIAEKYAKDPIKDMESYTYTLERTRSYLNKDDHVLELGCGTGSTGLLLAKSVKHYTASDVSPNMSRIGIEKAKKDGATNISFVTGDVLSDAIDDGPYNAVMAFNLLHLLEDLPAALTRIHGMLKPDGLFISKTVCRFGKETSLKYRLLWIALPVMQFFGKAPFVNLRPIPELEELITAHGFKIIETGNYPASPPSRYIVARKL